jgi:uncharacterized protein HemX
MADEVYTRETVPGDTTVIRETRTGSGAGWVIALVLVLALVAGVWFLTQNNRSEVAKNNAVTAAAHDVGAAAQNVGDAAQRAADNAANDASR